MLSTEVSKAPVERIRMDQIAVGKRLRERVGSVAELKKSIDDLGLMHPILVTQQRALTGAHGQPFLLIAGERRKRAHELLRTGTIPARIVEVSAYDLMRMEQDENECREDLDAYALSKPRWEEVLEEYQMLIAEYERGLTGNSGRAPRKAAPEVKKRLRVAARKKVGVDKRTSERDEKIVRAVKKYPELERFSQRPLKLAWETLESMPPSERKSARAFVAIWDVRECKEAAEALANIADWPEPYRRKIYRTMRTDPGHAQAAALGLPPVPDQRFLEVRKALDQLKLIWKSYRGSDDATNEIRVAREHMQLAYDILRAAYESKKKEFESELRGE